MKRVLMTTCALMLWFSFRADAQFEGVIDMKMTSHQKDSPAEMLYSMFVKKDMVAAHIKGENEKMKGGKFIFRGDKKLLWMINDDQKNYIEISLNDREKRAKSEMSKKWESKGKVRKTGKVQSILGYPCEEWIVEEDDEVSNIWGTSKLGSIYEGLMKSFGEMGGKSERAENQEWENELVKMKVFPLKIVTSKDGKLQHTQEVTKIQSQSVPAAEFEPPKGYDKQSFDLDMGKMMKQMQEQRKDRKQKGNDTSKEKIDIEKMMKDMQEKIQEKMQQQQEEKSDTTGGGN